MRFWQRKFIVVSTPQLSEDELASAFAVALTDKRHLALLQVIDELEQEANNAAQSSVASPGISASCNGGAEFMGRLRDRVLELQQKGFGKLSSERKLA